MSGEALGDPLQTLFTAWIWKLTAHGAAGQSAAVAREPRDILRPDAEGKMAVRSLDTSITLLYRTGRGIYENYLRERGD